MPRFAVLGHDRGGRVAYRMALDHPDRVRALAVLDILPTWAVWRGLTPGAAMAMYHWLMPAQPAPFPEMLIGKAPVEYLDYKLARWSKAKDLSAFDPAALADYRTCFSDPEHLRASCDDYRAGASFDWTADEADIDEGNRIHCPTLALWGEHGTVGRNADPLEVWSAWCTDLRGQAIDSGHFLPEENPRAVLDQLLPFLAEYAA
jgi:haloacetate dehalogenase